MAGAVMVGDNDPRSNFTEHFKYHLASSMPSLHKHHLHVDNSDSFTVKVWCLPSAQPSFFHLDSISLAH
eukprot:1156879-Pelagomonas_calceolata.AAC.5